MATMLKQSTAETIEFGPFVDKTDGDTEETALSLVAADILISKNHAALTAKSDATNPTGGTNAHYQVTLNTTDTGTLGRLRVYCHKTGALAVWEDFEVVPANVYDSFVAGTDTLQADLTQMGGVAQSATDLKDFADAGYDPATNKVQGLVLCDTLTTYTGNTVQTGDSYGRLGAPAGASVSADVAAVKVDTAAILVDTGTTLDTHLTDIKGTGFVKDTHSLPQCLTGSGTGLTALGTGTAQSGTASTIVLASASTFGDNVLNGNVIKITSGTGLGQARVIISNTLADDTCNIAPNWTTNPDATSVYEIVEGSVNVEAISLDNTSANNLELDYDGTGYDKSNSTMGTITSYTGNTVQTGDSYARLGAPAGASVSADVAAVKTDTAAVLVDTADMQPKLGTPAADVSADIAAVKVDTAATLVDTAQIGVAGAGLTNINLPNQTMDITGNLSGSIGSLGTTAKADVNAEVVDVLKTDTVAQLSQAAPPATPTLEEAVMYLYQYFRNKREQTATTVSMYDDAGTTVIAKSTISSDGTTFTKGEFATGP